MLAEESAAKDYRAWFWGNGARLGGWIGRPKDAPRWTPQQREEFREDWGQFVGPRNAGKTAVLEDGMEFNPITATARDSELVAARKLTREEVAAVYHVPPAMVGITEAQGYGSLREQHKALYQDTLGPLVAMLEGEIERQILPEFADTEDIYVEINIKEKLQGSFEEESSALITAVGSPYMSRNEARSRLNLPRINDADFDQPVTRLDLAEGQNAIANGQPVTAQAPAITIIDGAPAGALAAPELGTLADRLERALRVLPAAIAARLPAPPVPPPPVAVRRAIRDRRGHLTALEEYAADGTLVGVRTVIRDDAGKILELTAADPEVGARAVERDARGRLVAVTTEAP
jgi:hypothetical protein